MSVCYGHPPNVKDPTGIIIWVCTLQRGSATDVESIFLSWYQDATYIRHISPYHDYPNRHPKIAIVVNVQNPKNEPSHACCTTGEIDGEWNPQLSLGITQVSNEARYKCDAADEYQTYASKKQSKVMTGPVHLPITRWWAVCLVELAAKPDSGIQHQIDDRRHPGAKGTDGQAKQGNGVISGRVHNRGRERKQLYRDTS